MKEKLVKERYDLESWITSMLVSSEKLIHNLYLENICPSLKKILLQLKEKMNFPYGKTHLWQLLKKTGFSYGKWGRQRIISERSEIIAYPERRRSRSRRRRRSRKSHSLYGRDMAESGTPYKERKGRP